MRKVALLLSFFLGISVLLLAAPEKKPGPSVLEVSNWLEGDYRGVTPGNALRIRIRLLISDASRGYDHFVTVVGSHQGTNVRLNGLLRLEGTGGGFQATYIPHFDITVTEGSPGARRFTQRELDAACTVDFEPEGDGFLGETLGSRCAFAIRGAIGKWEVFLEPGALRLKQEKTGETLRFRKEREDSS